MTSRPELWGSPWPQMYGMTETPGDSAVPIKAFWLVFQSIPEGHGSENVRYAPLTGNGSVPESLVDAGADCARKSEPSGNTVSLIEERSEGGETWSWMRKKLMGSSSRCA